MIIIAASLLSSHLMEHLLGPEDRLPGVGRLALDEHDVHRRLPGRVCCSSDLDKPVPSNTNNPQSGRVDVVDVLVVVVLAVVVLELVALVDKISSLYISSEYLWVGTTCVEVFSVVFMTEMTEFLSRSSMNCSSSSSVRG